eukprot:TRINITY_DN8327_c0_g1_i1.p1 TRINITY_DN8327_c0_g1~~TRINITY_DN8327_c0_g1_i1.p1  ORF type:complete len:1298 (-),score=288.08 TRINITY_DN8327_c0_g1_i1:539-4432(-)
MLGASHSTPMLNFYGRVLESRSPERSSVCSSVATSEVEGGGTGGVGGGSLGIAQWPKMSEEERNRFGYNRRVSQSPRCSPRGSGEVGSNHPTLVPSTSLPGLTTSPSGFPKACNEPVELAALIDHALGDQEALRALLRMKPTAGRFDYKARIEELSGFTESLKAALSQQVQCMKDIKAAVIPIQESVNHRLSVVAEELTMQRVDSQLLGSELALARQKAETYDERVDDLRSSLHDAKMDRQQVANEWTDRMDTFQAICKRDLAEMANAHQRHLEEAAQQHKRQIDAAMEHEAELMSRLKKTTARQEELEAQVQEMAKDHDGTTKAHETLVRNNTNLISSVSELQAQIADKEELIRQKDNDFDLVNAKLAEAQDALRKRDAQLRELEDALSDRDELLVQREADLQELRAELTKMEELLGHGESDLQALHARLVEGEGLLETRANDLNVLQHELAAEADATARMDVDLLECKAQLAETCALLRERDCEVQNLHGELHDQDSDLHAAQAQLGEKERLLQAMAVEQQAMQVQLEEKESTLRQRNNDVQGLHSELCAREKALGEREGDIKTLKGLVGNSDSELKARQADVSELRSQLVKEELTVSKRVAEMEGLRAQLQEHTQLLQHRDGILEQREKDMQFLREQHSGKDEHTKSLQMQLEEKTSTLRARNLDFQAIVGRVEELEATARQRQIELQNAQDSIKERDDHLRQKDADLRESLASIKQMHSDNSEQLLFERRRAEKLEQEVKTLRTSDMELREKSSSYAQDLERVRADLVSRQEAVGELRSALALAEGERDQVADIAAKNQTMVRSQQIELSRQTSKLTAAQDDLSSAQAALAEKTREMESLSQWKCIVEAEFSSYKEHHGVGVHEQLGAIADLKMTIDRLSKQVDSKHTELSVTQGNVGVHRDYSKALEQRLADAERDRREMHNTIQELKGSIRVFCRIRPMPEGGTYEQALELAENDRVNLTHGGDSYGFGYDKIFGASSTQGEVFEEVSGFVQSALDGYKVCIFAYGQTGSGKTFTMQGTNEPSSWGLIPRSLNTIFQASKSMTTQGWTWSLQASFFEVYNETFRDLLQPSSTGRGSDAPVHVIKHDEVWGSVVTNMTSVDVGSLEQIRELTARAARQRSVGATDVNSVSSRSHSVFALYLRGSNRKLNSELHGALHLVDLAGSERLDKSGSTGDRLKETQNINRSLSSLADVFLAKSERRSHVPFRNSKLTHLMEPCLSGQGKTLMLVNVCPEESNAHETLCSLRFASQVNQCNTGGKAKRSVRTISDTSGPPAKAHTIVRMQSARSTRGY